MKEYNIPTPQEVDYWDSKTVDTIMVAIVQNLKNRRFSFKPESAWTPHFNTVKALLTDKWQLTSEWRGGREDGDTVWVLKPANAIQR